VGSSSLVTNASGQQSARVEYVPYGEIVTSMSSGADVFRPKFGGKEWDEDPGLYYFHARYYDPFIGRFLTADTQVQGGSERDTASLNPYAYANNSPIVYTDPSGQLFWLPILIAVAAGAYVGASAANGGEWNPAQWSWTSWQTYVGLGVGGIAGGLSAGVTIGVMTAGVMSRLGGSSAVGNTFRERIANKMGEKLAGTVLAKAVAKDLGKASLRVGGVMARSLARDLRESSSQPPPPPPPPPRFGGPFWATRAPPIRLDL
jgi:RHS repeat-associated protein